MAKVKTLRDLAEAFVWDGVMPNLGESSMTQCKEFWGMVRRIQAMDKAKLQARSAA